MSTLIEQIKLFLTTVNNGNASVTEEQAKAFGDACAKAFFQRFNQEKREYTIRASGIGKPLCQQQMEKAKAPREEEDYNFPMKMLFGDLIEAAAVHIMMAAGIHIEAYQQHIEYKINGDSIPGTLDIVIGGKLYDVKSCSPYAFTHKFDHPDGFNRLRSDDAFGYLAQAYLYSAGSGVPFGGWIAINKSTGEWTLLSPPIADNSYKKEAEAKAKENYEAIKSDAPFKRCFDLVEETWYGKKTGNHYLGTNCGYCPYKHSCWGDDLVLAAQPNSKAKNPPKLWYKGEPK